MKLHFVGALALLAAFSVPVDSQAAVFAGHLRMVDNGNGTFNLNYRLNEDANVGVTVRVKGPAPLNTVVRTFTLGAQTKGAQSVLWDGKNDSAAAVVPGQYSWEVEASTNNAGSDPYVKTVDGTQYIHTFFQPNGLDTDNVTTSPNFGTIYVSNSGGTAAASQRPTTDGIYVLSNDMADITNQGDTAYAGGVTWGAGSSPFRCFLAPDGKLFISDWSDSHSGVWMADPSNFATPYTEVLDNTNRAASGLAGNHGSIQSVFVKGVGAERVLYTLDEDYTDVVATSTGSGWAYPIGVLDSGYALPPLVEYDDAANGAPIINMSGKIIEDRKDGREEWFISQYRFTESEANPCLLHFTGSAVDWKSSVNFTGNLDTMNAGAFDVSADGNLVAAGINAGFKVADVTDLNNPSLIYTDTPAGNTKRDVAFDAAGNILLSSSSAETVIYYSKQGSNTFTTPNAAGQAVTVGSTSVGNWGIY